MAILIPQQYMTHSTPSNKQTLDIFQSQYLRENSPGELHFCHTKCKSVRVSDTQRIGME
jgi:hypothetical protein